MKFSALLFSLIAFPLSLFASEEPQFKISPQVLEIIPHQPNQTARLKIRMELPPTFHAYSDQFRVDDITPPDYQFLELKVLNEVLFFDRFSKKERKGFEENGDIEVSFNVSPDLNQQDKELSFSFRYQICSEKFCYLPKKYPVKVSLKYVKQKSESAKPTISRDDSLVDLFEKFVGESFFIALLICFIAGILTSFTPCIFPMIPITISILGHNAEKNSRVQNFVRSLFYVLGIAVTYSTLGVIAASSGKLFGSLFTNKWVMLSMSGIFAVMALSMWGLFELQVPAFIRNRFGSGKNPTHLGGVFVMGLISGVVASPCVGPVLVAILSYVATTQDVVMGFALLFTYAIGLGMIFIMLGIFGQALSALPRSGKWMNKIKLILGLLMVAMSLYYLQFALPIKDWMTAINAGPQHAEQDQRWVNYSEAQLEKAIAQGKPVIIDFRADWCVACHELDEKTFSKAEFKALSEKFILLQVDATEDTKAIQEILTKYSVKGLPTVVFINKSGQIISELTFTQFIKWDELEKKMQKALLWNQNQN